MYSWNTDFSLERIQLYMPTVKRGVMDSQVNLDRSLARSIFLTIISWGNAILYNYLPTIFV